MSAPGKDVPNSRTLKSVVYPSLTKLLKIHPEEDATAAIAQLKIAFDNCEKAKPGITHALVVQLIDQLKRCSFYLSLSAKK